MMKSLAIACLASAAIAANMPHLVQSDQHHPLVQARSTNISANTVRTPPQNTQWANVILMLQKTFPARLGSLAYSLFSCDYFYLTTAVPVEDDDSSPLRVGYRGLFVENQITGDLDGWIVNGSNWNFKSIKIPANLFNPSQAPDLWNWEDNGEWECIKVRNVWDDVTCTRKVLDNQYYEGMPIKWIGFHSDGNNHTWEIGLPEVMVGELDISPTDQCGDDISHLLPVVDPETLDLGSIGGTTTPISNVSETCREIKEMSKFETLTPEQVVHCDGKDCLKRYFYGSAIGNHVLSAGVASATLASYLLF